MVIYETMRCGVEKMKKSSEMSRAELARYIDHSVLKPEFTVKEIEQHIQEGIDFGCRTVCINPSSIDIARRLCADTGTDICVVCDFPFGLSTTSSRIEQARQYCEGNDIFELDIVANYGMMRSGMWTEVRDDLAAVIAVCHSYGTAVKVILETDALTMDQIHRGTLTAVEAGADFVKSSTGFYTGGEQRGATVEVIEMMMKSAGGKAKIKGSGCIRTKEHFLRLIDMGIDRMGIGYRSTPVVLGE